MNIYILDFESKNNAKFLFSEEILNEQSVVSVSDKLVTMKQIS